MKHTFIIPEKVSRVTVALKNAGFEAFLIGGCVRDLLMGKIPKDWDVTTNAKPEEIMPLFDKAVHENDFGMVAVIDESEEIDSPLRTIEVTTYRSETSYTNNRHPDSIEYAETLDEDVKRRDFRINAIAYDIENDIIKDIYAGQKDIEEKLIKTVGNSHDRFEEDALRILRAVRFTAQLGFTIEEETHEAIKKFSKNLKTISAERIRDEFIKLVDSAHPEHGFNVARETGLLEHFLPEMLEGVDIDQSRNHVYDVWNHLIKALQYGAEQNLPFHVKLAALFHDIGKPRTRRRDAQADIWTFYGHEVVGAKMVREIMKRLKFPKDLAEKVTKLVRWHMFFSDPDTITLSAVRRMIRNVGEGLIWDLMTLRQCDRKGMGRPKAVPYRLRKYHAMIDEALRDPISVQQLTLDGDYMIKKMNMKPGPRMGWILHALLEEVLEDPKKNTLEYLTERVSDLDEQNDATLKTLGEKGKVKKEEEEEKELAELRKQRGVR
jgi:poly(A) polymerase/tRNA nucleotidyltransferase (CCA-adding enzyme)